MKVRSFALKDSYGNTYSLDKPEETGFFTEPDGLGYDFDTNYIDVGDAFVRTKFKGAQAVVSGTLIFGSSSPYALYDKFNAFVRSGRDLQLVYTPPTGNTFYRDVDLVSLGKSEMSKGVLQCPVSFYCKSLFYANQNDNFNVQAVEGEMRYTIRFPGRYNDYNAHGVSLTNSGDVDAPFMATINGYCENPTITLKQNNQVLYSVTFPLTLQMGERIVYSTLDDDLYVYFIGSDGSTENIIQMLDINDNNFFKIPTGDSEISFTSDTGASFATGFTMYQFFRTV